MRQWRTAHAAITASDQSRFLLNQEDLSIYSVDQSTPGDPLSGGRAVAGFARPYARAMQGRLLAQHYGAMRACSRCASKPIPPFPPPVLALPQAQFPGGYSVHTEGAPLRWQIDGALLTL